jgi:hypothetical protein
MTGASAAEIHDDESQAESSRAPILIPCCTDLPDASTDTANENNTASTKCFFIFYDY